MSRLKKVADNKLNRQSFKQTVITNGSIPIDKDGSLYFVTTQINDQNFSDISEKFKQQLEDEGKYDTWCGFITSKAQAPYSMQELPIYGDSTKYVTKWFTYSPEEAIDQSLNDRSMQLLKRANAYMENNL